MPQAVPFVFISATSADLKSFRNAAKEELLTGGVYPVVQENFEPDYRTLRQFLRDKIARCDAVLCLVGFTYGAEPQRGGEEPDRQRRSYTQIEYDVARELNKPVYVFLAQEGCPFDQRPQEGTAECRLQQDHRRAIEAQGFRWTPFASTEELKQSVARIIPSLAPSQGRLAPHYEHLPRVPAFFAGRRLELAQLDRALGQSIPSLIAVVGIGGQGKTTLVHRWLQDHDPPDYDAVFWCTAYRGGFTFDLFLDRVLMYLLEGHFDKQTHPSREARIALLAGVLQKRRVLIVIDGVERWLRGWSSSVSGPQEADADTDRDPAPESDGLNDFLGAATALRNGSHLVLTTRALPSVLDTAQKAVLPVYEESVRARLEGLADDDAVALLCQLGVKAEPAPLRDLARRYGNHPLALSVLGAQLVERYRGVLETVPQVSPLRSGDLSELLKVTHQHLPGRKESERLLQVVALCVDVPALEVVAAGLNRKPTEAREALLDQAVMLARWQVLDWDGRVIRLHPLVKEYFARLVPKEEARVIHGRVGEWYGRLSLPEQASRLPDVLPRLLAIEHALRAGDLSRCAALVFSPVSAAYLFVEWLGVWGHYTAGIDLLGRLAEASADDRRGQFLIARAALLRQAQRYDEALADLDQAVAVFDRPGARSTPDQRMDLAGALLNRGNVLRQIRPAQSLRDYDRSVALFEELAARSGQARGHLANALMNRATGLRVLGHLSRALGDCDRASQVYQQMQKAGASGLEPILAEVLTNRASTLADLRRHDEALRTIDQVLALYRRLLAQGQDEYLRQLAHVLVTRGISLIELDRGEEALRECDQAILIVDQLVKAGRPELEYLLATAWLYRGLACLRLQRCSEAMHDCHRAVVICERLVAGGLALEVHLGHALLYRAETRYRGKDREGSTADQAAGFDLLRRLMAQGWDEARNLFLKRAVATADYLGTDDPARTLALLQEALDHVEQAFDSSKASEELAVDVRHTLPMLEGLLAALDPDGSSG